MLHISLWEKKLILKKGPQLYQVAICFDSVFFPRDNFFHSFTIGGRWHWRLLFISSVLCFKNTTVFQKGWCYSCIFWCGFLFLILYKAICVAQSCTCNLQEYVFIIMENEQWLIKTHFYIFPVNVNFFWYGLFLILFMLDKELEIQ